MKQKIRVADLLLCNCWLFTKHVFPEFKYIHRCVVFVGLVWFFFPINYYRLYNSVFKIVFTWVSAQCISKLHFQQQRVIVKIYFVSKFSKVLFQIITVFDLSHFPDKNVIHKIVPISANIFLICLKSYLLSKVTSVKKCSMRKFKRGWTTKCVIFVQSVSTSSASKHT